MQAIMDKAIRQYLNARLLTRRHLTERRVAVESPSLLESLSIWLCLWGFGPISGYLPVTFDGMQQGVGRANHGNQGRTDLYRQTRTVETEDSEVEKPIYRKPGFNGIRSLMAMEEELSRYLRERRDAQNLNREQVGMMIGIHAEILARHERAGAKLRVTRLIHLAELLDFSPIEAIYAAAPHLFGDSEQEADDQAEADDADARPASVDGPASSDDG